MTHLEQALIFAEDGEGFAAQAVSALLAWQEGDLAGALAIRKLLGEARDSIDCARAELDRARRAQ